MKYRPEVINQRQHRAYPGGGCNATYILIVYSVAHLKSYSLTSLPSYFLSKQWKKARYKRPQAVYWENFIRLLLHINPAYHRCKICPVHEPLKAFFFFSFFWRVSFIEVGKSRCKWFSHVNFDLWWWVIFILQSLMIYVLAWNNLSFLS